MNKKLSSIARDVGYRAQQTRGQGKADQGQGKADRRRSHRQQQAPEPSQRHQALTGVR